MTQEKETNNPLMESLFYEVLDLKVNANLRRLYQLVHKQAYRDPRPVRESVQKVLKPVCQTPKTTV